MKSYDMDLVIKDFRTPESARNTITNNPIHCNPSGRRFQNHLNCPFHNHHSRHHNHNDTFCTLLRLNEKESFFTKRLRMDADQHHHHYNHHSHNLNHHPKQQQQSYQNRTNFGTEKDNYLIDDRSRRQSTISSLFDVDFNQNDSPLPPLSPPLCDLNQYSSTELLRNHRKEDEKNGLLHRIFIILSYLLILSTFPFSLILCFKIVQEYERAVIFRLGKLIGGGCKGPGLLFILPCVDDYSIVDLRTITYDIPPQEILTKDSITVTVDAVLYFRIWLPTIAVSNVHDYCQATQLLTSVTLRNILGTKSLSEILHDPRKIAYNMSCLVDEITKSWGVKIERVEIKDVRLPDSLQRSMAIEAEATREARSKIIAAEGDLKSSFGIKEAANILATEPISLQLRYMQNIALNAFEKNTLVLFPVPIPMII
ncbi:hypothetical protein NH340_JMT07106 [Sarcoptes scabiei]|nr:hypothetical protein NH340_JMT07106 [Sarcoptes scabiei]